MRPLLYFSDGYPSLSQTFTRREAQALRAAGLPVQVVSLHPPRDIDPRPDASVDPPVTVLPHPATLEVASSLARAAARRTGELARLALAAASPHTTPWHAGLQARAPVHLAWATLVAERVPQGAHLHAQFCGAASNVAWMAARLAGATFSFMAHADHGLPLVAHKLRDATFVLSISELERRRMLALAPDAPEDRVRVHRLGVDLAAWDLPAPAAEPDALRVVAVGMLGPTKGHDVLIAAVGLARARGAQVRLDVVGEGAERPRLEAAVARLGLGDAVRLRGALSHEAVRKVVRESHACALACRVTPSGDSDGIPLALMEGMAARRAIVSCPVGAIAELVEHGVSGLLVPPERPELLADALVRLAADPELRRQLGDAARRRMEESFDERRSHARLVETFRAELSR